MTYSFAFFASILTGLYFAYLAIAIYMELKKSQDKDKKNVEEFDVSTFQVKDNSIHVTESQNGFTVGDEPHEAPATVQKPKEEVPETEKTEVDKKIERTNDKMEEITPYSGMAYTKEKLFEDCMKPKKPTKEEVGIKEERTQF